MSRKVLLIEPNYKNKYPPMSLMKIATYYRQYCGDDVKFFKGNLTLLVLEDIYDVLLKKLYANDATIFWEEYKPDILQYIKKGSNETLKKLCTISKSAIVKELFLYYRKYYFKKEYFKAENRIYDIVCITTLFTFYWDITIKTIEFAKQLCKNTSGVKVGGIMASILCDRVKNTTGVTVITGTLDKAGMLGDDNDIIIDSLPLDYSILDEIDYKYPVHNAYFSYMTRGCVNKCAFCAVPKVEPQYKEYLSIFDQMKRTSQLFGERKDLLLLDNNVLASREFNKIIDEIKLAGFAKGEKWCEPNYFEIAITNLKNGYNEHGYIKNIVCQYKLLLKKFGEGLKDIYYILESKKLLKDYTATKTAILETYDIVKPYFQKLYGHSKRTRYIDFNQGLDARLVTIDNMKKLAEVAISPVRIAFDHWELRNVYEKAVRCAASAGHKKLSNYILYNFKDKPEDLYNRLKFNIELSEELGISIYSFPMKYHPIDDEKFFSNRNYCGEYWNRKYIRAIQAILNSTKGKIGKGKEFFEEAFGRNVEEFHKILLMPETFIIYRRRYDKNLREKLSNRYKNDVDIGCNDSNEWWANFNNLSVEQRKIIEPIIKDNNFSQNVLDTIADKKIRDVLRYYTIKR